MNEHQPDRDERVRAYLGALVARSKTPGIQYLVLDSAETVFEYHGGWADLRDRIPMDSTTTMMAYSMSKPITAAAVLQLVEARRVGLDEPVARYLDALPYGPDITVRQLLAHTSGIPNPIPLRWVHAAARHATFDEGAALARVLRRHPRPAAEPGARYGYSNIGYWLLGSVVERTSGESFPAYVTGHVLDPLGIAPEQLGYTIADPARQATGYLEKYSAMNLIKGFLIDPELIGEYDGRWLRIESHYVNGAAFGGLVGSARGIGIFLQDQLRPRSHLFDDTTRRLFYTPQEIRNGTPVAMTLGWHIGELEGQRFFYKEGGGGGFHHMMRLYPTRGLATVIMTNATGFPARRSLDALDAQFLR